VLSLKLRDSRKKTKPGGANFQAQLK
jgi:hypothetical protein